MTKIQPIRRRRLKPWLADILLTINMMLFVGMIGFVDGPTETFGITNVLGVLGCLLVIYMNHLVLKLFDGYYYIERGNK